MKKYGLEPYEEFKSIGMADTQPTTQGVLKHIRTSITVTPTARTKHKRQREVKDFDVGLLAVDEIDPSSFKSPPYLKIGLVNPKPTDIDNLTLNNCQQSLITSHPADQPPAVQPASLLPSKDTTVGTMREPMSLLFDTDKIGLHKLDKRSIKAIDKTQKLSEKLLGAMNEVSNALASANSEL